MIDILDVINEATKEANAFENHAAKGLSLEERVLYLQGLALVMNADGDIDQKEKEYLRILIKSFELDESILDSLVEFGQAPDKDTVQAFFRTFRRRPIAQLFLFDALMMTRRDDNIDDREKAVVDKIAEQLEVLQGTYQDIYDLFCHIKNKDWDESALYFSSHLLNPEHFKHLLDYFEVDFEELMNRTVELRKDRIIRILKEKITPNFDSETPKLRLSAEVLLPLLQSCLDRREISIIGNSMIFDEINEVTLSELNLYYNQEARSLSLAMNGDVCNEMILKKWSSVIGLDGLDVCNIIWGSVNEMVVYGTADIESPQLIKLSRAYKKGQYILFDGYLWEYKDVSRYNIYNQNQLVIKTLSSSFDDVKSFMLKYSLDDDDSKGRLAKVNLF
ncbi:TerB family tellurite resistance protein [Vibrio renipiscarius]|uniref:Co-chaperone DjlA N-terminal domain-containing protein n=1 Tax=Vibrio renipiscarius TaxID=1461322 RepID=A0A0C2NX89_9VIBR|nr:TerB family tellurite resistance protein [Vibrio renipiscarius]KII75370.1 hypothetical protein OJ16_18965 [Vibrio renipiscarius]KII78822.1 hypothetical protein PL18_11075 [Vibrio renipiscarius]